MSAIYDNWERLVAAVVKREEIWQLCHQPYSRSPSVCSESSDFISSSFRLSDVNTLQEEREESIENPVPNLDFLGGFAASGFPLPNTFKAIKELGDGTFGTSILTQLQQDVKISDQEYLYRGTKVVIKLLKNVKLTGQVFKQQMMVFGNCRHENVAAPRAYFFSDKAKGKLIIYDYYSRGSLSDMLQDIVGELNHHRPSWRSRLKVAIGAARGIAHIHRQFDGKLAHGNIKSSNIFLNSQRYGCLSDFGLAGKMVKPRKRGAVDYRAPGYENKNASQESDVYSFGVVLLELLTGKSAMKNQHILACARSIGTREWTSGLFDQSLTGGLLVDEKDMLERDEMKEMLQVVIRCLAMFPKDRPKMFEVVLMLENIAPLGL